MSRSGHRRGSLRQIEGADSLAPLLRRSALRSAAEKLGTVSENVLAEQLRQLEAHGVIARDVSQSVPPAVTYSLNDAGRARVALMEGLCDWGSAHFGIEPTLPRRSSATA
jgi:DNA-binding HxlR family transcriptional regulator